MRAREQVEQRQGERLAVGDMVVQRVSAGLRRRLLGEPAAMDDVGPLVAELNRLAEDGEKSAILLDDVDHADPSTLALLRRFAEAPGWLRPTLLLSCSSTPETGPLAELLSALEQQGAILRPPTADPALPVPVLRTLRALAVAGGEASAHTIAALLGEDELRVLERAQEAIDLGFPLQDLGAGMLALPPAQAATLESGLTPSLLEAWRARLAQLRTPSAGAPELTVAPEAAVIPELTLAPEATVIPAPFDSWPAPADRELQRPTPPLGPAEPTPEPKTPVDTWPDLSPAEPTPEPNPPVDTWPELGQAAAKPPPGPPTPAPSTPWPEIPQPARPRPKAAASKPKTLRDDTVDTALETLLAQVAGAPAYAAPQVVHQLQEALALLARLPATPRRRMLRARVHMELGRVCWLDAGLMQGLNLDAALLQLEQAERLLDAQPEAARLRAELRVLTASVCYDRGDPDSLERALTELTEAIRDFSGMGDPRTAARLLNDQATVWVRIGDVVRAAHLLRQSRELLTGLGDAEAADRADLAETNHLLARLPLHVSSRPGREQDALHQALTHAREAEASYGQLGLRREQARTWSTLGRLHLMLGEASQARKHLNQAFHFQEQLGDALGLAQTAGALAEALALEGDAARALEMLSSSIALNANLGARAGLRANRESIDAIARAWPAEHPGVRQALAKLRRTLDQAEGRQREAGG